LERIGRRRKRETMKRIKKRERSIDLDLDLLPFFFFSLSFQPVFLFHPPTLRLRTL